MPEYVALARDASSEKRVSWTGTTVLVEYFTIKGYAAIPLSAAELTTCLALVPAAAPPEETP